ncbi:MAG: hypothetical protein V4574_12350 [Pseudomonadota bacterium]
MRAGWIVAAATLAGVAAPAQAQYLKPGFALPEGRKARVMLVCPDLTIGSMNARHEEAVNPDWTRTGYANLRAALAQGPVGKAVELGFADCDPAEAAPDWLAETRTMVNLQMSDLMFRVPPGTFPLPNNDLRTLRGKKIKTDQFRYGIGPARAARLRAELGAADYAFFLLSHDSYSTPGEMTGRIAGLFIGIANHPPPHYANSALVDLADGTIVWTHMDGGVEGDMRKPEGAALRAAQVTKRFPGVR